MVEYAMSFEDRKQKLFETMEKYGFVYQSIDRMRAEIKKNEYDKTGFTASVSYKEGIYCVEIDF